MILKGSQRANGSDLATHLMNEFDNEYAVLAELRGTVAGAEKAGEHDDRDARGEAG